MPVNKPNLALRVFGYSTSECGPAAKQWTRIIESTSLDKKIIGDCNENLSDRLSPGSQVSTKDGIGQNDELDQETEKNFDPDWGKNDFIPWKSADKTYPPNLQGLHNEVIDFYGYMRPWKEESIMRQDLINRIKQIVIELWPNAKVETFGSFTTGLYLPSSDIDLVIFGPSDSLAMSMLEKQLLENSICDPDTIKVLDKTTVPIVKLTDRVTDVRVDISFNVSTGLRSAQFVKDKIEQYPSLPSLVFVLKQYLLQHELLEAFNGGISSYCLTLLVVSFLQLHQYDMSDSSYLGRMLVEFLELYGRFFNYMKIGVRVQGDGGYVPKEEIQKMMEDGYLPSLLCIEDPINPKNDVGRSCFGVIQVKEKFDVAYQKLRDAVLPQYSDLQPQGGSILGRIIWLTPEFVRRRREVCNAAFAERLHQNREKATEVVQVIPPFNTADVVERSRQRFETYENESDSSSTSSRGSSTLSSVTKKSSNNSRDFSDVDSEPSSEQRCRCGCCPQASTECSLNYPCVTCGRPSNVYSSPPPVRMTGAVRPPMLPPGLGIRNNPQVQQSYPAPNHVDHRKLPSAVIQNNNKQSSYHPSDRHKRQKNSFVPSS